MKENGTGNDYCKLCTVYSETPVTGPDTKRVKVSNIHQCFVQQFASDAIAPPQIDMLIKKAFPNVQSSMVESCHCLNVRNNTFIHNLHLLWVKHSIIWSVFLFSYLFASCPCHKHEADEKL